ncbi:hypothetical protein Ae201684P_007275 [Aphanomyces euteiches]|uniref:Uncharacterized protein n=1 Tax=Aphanomyces euteiches TaxID=100861 RepID=A0A6G0WV81_9STRA|nr:hypothetical protein Ae201684_011274 [Aphanomyces euteiches]KAH9101087.1 hypothetical protein Ae201684P_007275 [Aphanomyces euteiches]
MNCMITASIANNLLKWITLQPIQHFEIANFTWKNFSLLVEIVTALLDNTTIECFKIFGIATSTISFRGHCGCYDSGLHINVYKPDRYGVEDVIVPEGELNQDLSGFIQLFFESLLKPKVKKLRLSGHSMFKNGVIWEMLHPYSQQSHLEELDLRGNNLEVHEGIQLAEGIRSMSSLKKINLDGNGLGYAGMKAIVAAAPDSMDRIYSCLTIGKRDEISPLEQLIIPVG